MKLTIERTALLKSLNHVQNVVERRNTIPILSNVLIEGVQGGLRLKATDLDLEAVEAVPADIAGEGATTVPAHMFYDIVRKLPEGSQVELQTSEDGASISVRSGRSRFTLQTLPKDDFPDLDAGAMGHRFTLSANDLKRLIDKTRFAMSTEETRYYLNGIFLHCAETDGLATLRAVATDGHRLARIELPAPEGSAGMPGIIVPRKTVEQLHRLIEDQEAPVTVEMSDAKIRFTFGQVVLTSKLIDGTFPDYARVIPQGNDKRLEVDAARFAQAVDRVSTISSERGRAVKLNLEGEKLVLSVNNPDSGSASEEIEVSYSGEALEIGFNSRYLLDIAGQLDHETARFDLADPGSPALVRDVSDEAALYVLMPMRV
ncbi:MAG TPA: DNA polymerase III subunit beta [Hyphomicrobiales bacterium]|nr:DNA polymerase III subunit beta [Rhodobiaceae bacterium]HXK53753.1 DNA polymerase III subunit beta [Hyphomicrobiales bacterium]